MRNLVAIFLVLAACSDDEPGLPFEGDASGQYGDDGFDPQFAVAFTREDGGLEIQFGETAISCGNHLREGTGNPQGLFVRLMLRPTQLAVGGEITGVWIEYDLLQRSGTHQSFSTDAKVTLTALDDTQVAGAVTHTRTHETLGTLAFNGAFTVTRCD